MAISLQASPTDLREACSHTRPARGLLPHPSSRNQGIEESGAGGQYCRGLILVWRMGAIIQHMPLYPARHL